jgi:hypothetical protein
MEDPLIETREQSECLDIVMRFASQVILSRFQRQAAGDTKDYAYDRFFLGVAYLAVEADLRPNPLATSVWDRSPSAWNRLHDRLLERAATRERIPLNEAVRKIYPAHYSSDDWYKMVLNRNARLKLKKYSRSSAVTDSTTLNILRSIEDRSLIIIPSLEFENLKR